MGVRLLDHPLVPEDITPDMLARDFVSVAHATMLHGVRAYDGAVKPHLARILKAATSPVDSTDTGEALVALQRLGEAFAGSLVGQSVFDTLLSGGMVRTPLHASGAVVTVAPVGSAVDETAVKPISEMTLTGATVKPQKCWSAVVATRELLDLARPGASEFFAGELRKAVTRAVDSVLLTKLFADVTPTASAGPTFANLLTDINALLDAVDVQPTSKVYWVVEPDRVKTWTTMLATNNGFAFPDLTIAGGPICGGITVIPSSDLPGVIGSPGTAASILIVADGLRGNHDRFEFKQIRQGDIILDTAPDSPSTAGTLLKSMWQSNLAALAIERYFAFEVGRARSVAALSY